MTDGYSMCAARVIARCREIARITDVPGETNRPFLSPATRAVHALLQRWMEDSGMSVHIDAAGNIRGLWPGADTGAPRLLIGSHLDTVPNAGAFDGILGVVIAIALVEELRGQHLPFAIEIIGFSEEEGVRFQRPFLGSLALVGKLDQELQQGIDADGISVAEALQSYGLDATRLSEAVLSSNTFGYLEVHIEQGPVLESEDTSLGVVHAIIGQTRMQIVFEGSSNHAGTTPMHLRHDALAVAAEWITAVEQYALSHAGSVATVGRIEAHPNVGNIIAGAVTVSLDVRHRDDGTRAAAVGALLEAASNSASKRGVSVIGNLLMEQVSVPMDANLCGLLHRAAERAGSPARPMTSGAGHDAMILAPAVPATMLFLRTPGGLSHHPDESVEQQDIEAALAASMEFLDLLRGDTTEHKDDHA